MSEETRIAIIGTGNVGGALGERFVKSGYPVMFGTRPGGDASGALARSGGKATAGLAPEAAAWGEVVFLAVPGGVAVEVARSLGDLSGKILVDCNNPLRWEGGPVWNPPPEGSLSAAIAKAAPGARVVKAFNTFGAEFHRDPAIGDTPVDVFLAGDDNDAKQTVSSIANRAGFSAIDAGPLRNAAALENLAILWIHLAMVGGQGRNIAFKMLKR